MEPLGCFRATWDDLVSLGHLGASWNHLGVVLGGLYMASQGHQKDDFFFLSFFVGLGAVLCRSWGGLGVILGHLGVSWAILGLLGSLFGWSWAVFAWLPRSIKKTLGTALRIAVLEGVDPSPTNLCAAGALAAKGGAMPPAPGGHYCLLLLEIVPNHATGSDGSKRAASRLTVRATSASIGEPMMQALTAQMGGVLPPSNRL